MKFIKRSRRVYSSLTLSFVFHLVIVAIIGYYLIMEKKKEDVTGVDIMKVEQQRVRPRSLPRPILQKQISQIKPRSKRVPEINHRIDLPKTYANFRLNKSTDFFLPQGFSRSLKKDFANIKPSASKLQIQQSSISSMETIQAEINTKIRLNMPDIRSRFLSSSKIERVSLGGSKGKMIELISTIKRKIELAKRYPRQAREAGYEGTVIVLFQINQYGNLKEVEIIGSSGYSILDDEAIMIVKRASPFPSLDGYVTEEEGLCLKIPVEFRLKEV